MEDLSRQWYVALEGLCALTRRAHSLHCKSLRRVVLRIGMGLRNGGHGGLGGNIAVLQLVAVRPSCAAPTFRGVTSTPDPDTLKSIVIQFPFLL